MAPSEEILSRRFWARVDKTPSCWLWRGAQFSHGYGKVVRNGKFLLAHRVAYGMLVGPITAGRCLCHHCDTPLCVNPTHLFQGTMSDNMRDMVQKGRSYNRHGARNGRARLRPEQAAEIRIRYKRGLGTVLAREFSIGRSQIYEIARGVSWRA